jgi:hypothetical protein
MNYWDNIGPEKIDREYKVFNFNPLKLSVDDGIKYLANGIFCFNDSVDETIKNYLEIYLPKYLCSFFNPSTDLKHGKLYFGIDDDGKIIGIPYIGELSKDIINHVIDKIFFSHIKFPNKKTLEKIRLNTQVEIIKIEKKKFMSKLNNQNKNKKSSYAKYLEEFNKIKHLNKIHTRKRKVWNSMFDLDKLKLHEMINDEKTRKYIWKYVKIKTGYSLKKFKNKYTHLGCYCDVDDYWNLMSNIKSNYQFTPFKLGTMCDVSNDNLDIYKWVAVWKDSKLSMLKKAKPKKPTKKIDSYYPLFLLSQVPKMIPEWIKNNRELNLFVIKINFNIDNSWETLEYKDVSGQWKYSYRTVMDGKPMSLSFYSVQSN